MRRDFRHESDWRIREYIRSEDERLPPRNPLREHPVHRWDREANIGAARDELRRREREAEDQRAEERREERRAAERREAREREAQEAAWEQERLADDERREREYLENLFRRAAQADDEPRP